MYSHSAIHLTQQFIQYPTVSSAPIIEFASLLASMGEDIQGHVDIFQTNTHKQNVMVHFGPREESIALSGHMDVVPVDGQNWDVNPFSGEIQDDKLMGRGSCDMKAFIGICYAVLAKIPRTKLRKGISLVWTHDEEIGCVGATNLVQQLQEKEIVLAPYMLIGEPTDLQIFHHHGGHVTIEIIIRGKPAHSSKPYLGISANEWLFTCWTIVNEWKEWLDTQISPITNNTPVLNIAEIQSGSAINIVPEHATMRIGLRPMPGHNTQNLLQYIQDKIVVLQEKISAIGGSIEFRVPQQAPPMHTTLPHPIGDTIIQNHPHTICTGAPFATDGGCFAQMDCKPIICGPGSIDLAHKANEYVTIDQMIQYEKLLERIIHKHCIEVST